MRTVLLNVVALFFLSSFVLAQSNYKQGNKWGCTIAVNDAHSQIPFLAGAALQIDADGNMIGGGDKTNNSYSLSIIPKYYINNDWVVRFEYGMTKIDLKDKGGITSSTGYLISPSYGQYYDTVEQEISRLAPSIQWNFFSNNKIQSYGGVSLIFIKYGAITRYSYSESRNVATDTLINWGRSSVNIPGGNATGLGVFAGFNIYITKHLSLGAEFSSAMLHYNVGGGATNEYSDQSIPNPVESATQVGYESYKGTRFAKILSSFNISAWF
jgi:hypothetical protein